MSAFFTLGLSGKTAGGAAAGDWRLPEIGEYSDLYADPDVGSTIAGLRRKFSDVQSDFYWSGTEYAPNPSLARTFFTRDGDQPFGVKSKPLYAVAVRPGDVAASVPEPQTLALALLALGAKVAARRRRPA